MKTLMKLLPVWMTALTLGAVGLGCNAVGQDETDSTLAPQNTGQSRAELDTPSNSVSWSWGSVTNFSMGQGGNVAFVAPGATITGNTSFSINAGAGGCPGCISQVVLTVDGGARACIYSGGGVIQSSAGFSLTAPSTPGLYPVRVSSQWMWDCAGAIANSGDTGPIIGLIAVSADPASWGWGRVSNVKLNGNAVQKLQVTAGQQFSLSADYFVDAGIGGCPGCVSQVVLGVQGGSKSCVYSGMGVVQSSASTTLTAPGTPGVYPIWANGTWMWNCQDGANNVNDGAPVGFIEVLPAPPPPPPSQPIISISIDTAGCSTNVAINNAIGQSFRVSAQTTVEKIEVWIKPELYYTTSYGLEVFDGEGTGGTKLATSQTTLSLDSQTAGVPSGFYAFSFSGQGLSLQPDHAYTFRLVRLSQYSGAFSQCGNVYSGGSQYWLGYSSDPSYDVAFKLYAGSSTPPPPAAGVYQGCYTDDGARALPNYFGDGFTQESCTAAAAAAGLRYAGLQYFGQCFAGNQLGYAQVADSECNTPCNANPSQMCGGAWRNSIYTTGR